MNWFTWDNLAPIVEWFVTSFSAWWSFLLGLFLVTSVFSIAASAMFLVADGADGWPVFTKAKWRPLGLGRVRAGGVRRVPPRLVSRAPSRPAVVRVGAAKVGGRVVKAAVAGERPSIEWEPDGYDQEGWIDDLGNLRTMDGGRLTAGGLSVVDGGLSRKGRDDSGEGSGS